MRSLRTLTLLSEWDIANLLRNEPLPRRPSPHMLQVHFIMVSTRIVLYLTALSWNWTGTILSGTRSLSVLCERSVRLPAGDF